jgi:tetratricopeptide (TPR) repeat protein
MTRLDFLQALKLFRELEHLTNIGMSLYMLARIAAFNYDRQADALFEEARVFLEQAGAHRQACQAITGMGDCAFARCDFYTARDLYIKATNTLKKNGFLHSITGGYAQLSVGEAAACLYNYPEANHWLGEAKRTFEKTSSAAYGQMISDITYGMRFHPIVDNALIL